MYTADANLPRHCDPWLWLWEYIQTGLVVSGCKIDPTYRANKAAPTMENEDIKNYTSDKTYTLTVAFYSSMSFIPSYVII